MRATMHCTVSHALRIPNLGYAPRRRLLALNPRLTTPSKQIARLTNPLNPRAFHTSPVHSQSPSPASTSNQPPLPSRPQSPHTSFYRTHGRALFKALTLAFFTYQVVYWAWLVLETEETKAQKSREIRKLEGEVRLLDERRKGSLAAGGGEEKG